MREIKRLKGFEIGNGGWDGTRKGIGSEYEDLEVGERGERRGDWAEEVVVREVEDGELGELGDEGRESAGVGGGVEGELGDSGGGGGGGGGAGEAAGEVGDVRGGARVGGEVPGG